MVFLYHKNIIQHMTIPQVADGNNIITVSKNGIVPAVEKFYLVHSENFGNWEVSV